MEQIVERQGEKLLPGGEVGLRAAGGGGPAAEVVVRDGQQLRGSAQLGGNRAMQRDAAGVYAGVSFERANRHRFPTGIVAC